MGSMSCLALNASFEPLTIVPTRRAIRLVLDRKAEILEVDEKRCFRSERKQLPCPSVIRLVRYVHVPRRFRRQVTNTFLFARDDYSCQYCGRHRSELKGRQFLTRDHILPLARRGEHVGERGHLVLPLQQPEGESSPRRSRDGATVRPRRAQLRPSGLGRPQGDRDPSEMDRHVLRPGYRRSAERKEQQEGPEESDRHERCDRKEGSDVGKKGRKRNEREGSGGA